MPVVFLGTVEERAELESVVARTTAPAGIVLRARIVLAVLFDGCSVRETARRLQVVRDTVRKWRDRYLANRSVGALRDRPRTGRPPRFTARDQAVILSLAVREPEELGRLEACMTQSLIVELAASEGLKVSRSTVQRTLACAEIRPDRCAYYLFTPKDHAEYAIRRDAICWAYTTPLPADEVVVCFDEKTCIQVLGVPKGTPLGGRRRVGYGGRVRRLEHNYVRHGARTLVAAVRPDTGEVIAAELFPARGYATTEAIAMLQSIAVALPHARRIHLIWDNASTHTSAAMREFLASEEGRRFEPRYTPTHASWLNLCENFFSRFTTRYLRGRRYEGLDQFDDHVYAALEAYNDTARPYRWTYNPRAAAA